MAVGLMTCFCVIVLMVLLSIPEFPCFVNTGRDMISFALQLPNQLFGYSFLLFIHIKNSRPILCADIRPLPVTLCRVMNLEKKFCKSFITDQSRIELDLNSFSVSCLAATNLFVGRDLRDTVTEAEVWPKHQVPARKGFLAELSALHRMNL